MSNNNSIRVNINNQQNNMVDDLLVIENDDEIINHPPSILLYNTFQRNIFNQNGSTIFDHMNIINHRYLMYTIDDFFYNQMLIQNFLHFLIYLLSLINNF